MGVEAYLRIGNKCKIGLLKRIINRIVRIVYSCDVPCDANIHHSVRFGHNGLGCVVHKDAIIEEKCFIQHRVTIGVKRTGEGAPVVHKGVAIGPGAIIIGNIEIGECAVIGAGAVVTKDVPPFSVVGGVPAKVLYMQKKDDNTL